MKPGSFALLVLLPALLAASAATATVQAGPIVNPANGHTYSLLAPSNWLDAEAEAQTLGGHLVAIGDDAENTWVWETFAAIAGSGPFWIGASDAAQEGTFVWTNGEPFDYTNWWTAGGAPDGGASENYVELNNYLWNDNSSAPLFRAVVEIEPAAFRFVEAEAVPPPPPSAFEQVFLYGLEVSPDGRHVYVLYDVAIGDDKVLIYERAADGSLTLIGSPVVATNPLAMAMARDGSAIFVVGNNGDLQAWHRTSASGLLDFVDGVYDDVDGGGYLQYARGVAVSPDGRNVYVAGGENAVTSFDWDGAALALRDTDVSGTPAGLVLSSPGPITVTPDGRFVLVISTGDNALVVFARDPSSGALTFADRFVDGANGVDGLGGPTALVAARSTGSNAVAYVAGQADGKLAVFSQAAAVSFVEAVSTGAGSWPNGLAVSSDGTRLYATDYVANNVTAYERDPASGALGAVAGAIADSDPGVNGLANPSYVAASRDGRNVYVASSQDDAIAVLATATPEPASAAAGLTALLTLRGLARRRRIASPTRSAAM